MERHIIEKASTLDVEWQKAQASGGNGNCIELADLGDGVALRHSKAPSGPALVFTRAEMAAWLDGAKGGEFDRFAQ